MLDSSETNAETSAHELASSSIEVAMKSVGTLRGPFHSETNAQDNTLGRAIFKRPDLKMACNTSMHSLLDTTDTKADLSTSLIFAPIVSSSVTAASFIMSEGADAATYDSKKRSRAASIFVPAASTLPVLLAASFRKAAHFCT